MRPSMKVTMSRRAGFTLIELLIAITIIILLIGLLVPALSAVRRNARIAEVKAEIGQLEAALTQFQTHYGQYPPSRIKLCKDATGWGADAEARRSRAILRQLWPSFDFSSDGSGDGSFSAGWLPAGADSVTLDGAECLLFFLGGRRNADEAYIGFSNNPAQPFALTPTDSRVGPFLELKRERYMRGTAGVDDDGDGFYEYLDPLTDQAKPYIYLSSYDGRGYETADLGSHMTDFYKESGTTGWKAKSFQIISAGFDGDHGVGGLFDPKTADSTLIGPRAAERDNITNFHGGTLAN